MKVQGPHESHLCIQFIDLIGLFIRVSAYMGTDELVG